MSSVTPFIATDLLYTNSVNLDVLTENYPLSYYAQYMLTWPSMMFKSQSLSGSITGYMIGKSEGNGLDWHSHITALSVAYNYRRLGLANMLVHQLVKSSEEPSQDCYFMDLYVRSTNNLAINMYKRMGFSAFRKVLAYYNGGGPPTTAEDDAYDMRKPLKRDKKKQSLVKGSHTVEIPYYKYVYQ